MMRVTRSALTVLRHSEAEGPAGRRPLSFSCHAPRIAVTASMPHVPAVVDFVHENGLASWFGWAGNFRMVSRRHRKFRRPSPVGAGLHHRQKRRVRPKGPAFCPDGSPECALSRPLKEALSGRPSDSARRPPHLPLRTDSGICEGPHASDLMQMSHFLCRAPDHFSRRAVATGGQGSFACARTHKPRLFLRPGEAISMDLSTKTKRAPRQITARLRAGGVGEVSRPRDTPSATAR